MLRHFAAIFFSLICLPVAVLVMVMWGRSYFVLDRLSYRSLDNQDCRICVRIAGT